jgi:hypothetical protein
MLLRDATACYHDLLDDDIATASQAQLDDQLKRRGLYFGQRPLCTVLRPRFLTTEQYRWLKGKVRRLLHAFDTAYRSAVENADFRAQFGLLDWEEELIERDPGFRQPSPLGRLDMFYLPEDGQLKLVEYNAETPAAQAYNDVLCDVFAGLPIMRTFARRYDARPLLARQGVLHALLDAYTEWAGDSREPPRVAILDWREVPTYSEFLLFADYLRAQGLECVIADPRAVEYRDGQLVANGLPVNLIYKRVLLSELVERGGLDHPVLQAVRDGTACMVNPHRCKLLHKKTSLAVLSDERNEALFSAEERQAIAAHIPWTRRVEERYTTYQGQDVDLLPFVLAHRDQLVLKANDDYGGKGIYLGWETEPTAWEEAMRAALSGPFVVQERVAVPSEPFPSVVEGRMQLLERMLDTDPFVCCGEYGDGCLTRLSTVALLNVTAGGGSQVPTFLVEER